MIINPNVPEQGGVTSFKGRKGAVEPAAGDYTAAQVGALPSGGTVVAAQKLATARAVDGVAFDGSAAITHYGTCSTAADTVAKTVALPGFSLVTGARVAVKFDYANSAANPTLNVNNTGSKSIYYANGKTRKSGLWGVGKIVEFIYDGTNWLMVNPSFEESNGTASGDFAHAENNGIASGANSHAEGGLATASGFVSHAEGSKEPLI